MIDFSEIMYLLQYCYKSLYNINDISQHCFPYLLGIVGLFLKLQHKWKTK